MNRGSHMYQDCPKFGPVHTVERLLIIDETYYHGYLVFSRFFDQLSDIQYLFPSTFFLLQNLPALGVFGSPNMLSVLFSRFSKGLCWREIQVTVFGSSRTL